MAKEKLCIDCHWSRNKHMIASQWHCASPRNARPNTRSLVDGKPRTIADSCEFMRNYNCGPEGSMHQTTQEVYPTSYKSVPQHLVKNLRNLRVEDLE